VEVAHPDVAKCTYVVVATGGETTGSQGRFLAHVGVGVGIRVALSEKWTHANEAGGFISLIVGVVHLIVRSFLGLFYCFGHTGRFWWDKGRSHAVWAGGRIN